jgi:hypothetical protein
MSTKIEIIKPYIRAPWWISKTRAGIASDEKAAKSRDDDLINSMPDNIMTIYTDSSGIMEKFRAAAYNQTLNETAYQYYGGNLEYNVYGAELTTLDVGIATWQNHANDFPQRHIFTDSRAASSSIQQPRRQSGQYIITSTLDRIDQIIDSHPQRQLKTVWIRGHMNIEVKDCRHTAYSRHFPMLRTNHRCSRGDNISSLLCRSNEISRRTFTNPVVAT